MDTVEFLGFAAGLITGITFIPQIFKTMKSKSVGDISVSSFALVVTSNVLWLVYGIIRMLPSVIVTNSVVLITALVMIFFKFYYSKK